MTNYIKIELMNRDDIVFSKNIIIEKDYEIEITQKDSDDIIEILKNEGFDLSEFDFFEKKYQSAVHLSR